MLLTSAGFLPLEAKLHQAIEAAIYKCTRPGSYIGFTRKHWKSSHAREGLQRFSRASLPGNTDYLKFYQSGTCCLKPSKVSIARITNETPAKTHHK